MVKDGEVSLNTKWDDAEERRKTENQCEVVEGRVEEGDYMTRCVEEGMYLQSLMNRLDAYVNWTINLKPAELVALGNVEGPF